MSHSYKKHPYCGDNKSRFYKRYANRKLRRIPIEEEIPSGKAYRKYECYYNICDYWSYNPDPWALPRWCHLMAEINEEEQFWRWYKNCKMK